MTGCRLEVKVGGGGGLVRVVRGDDGGASLGGVDGGEEVVVGQDGNANTNEGSNEEEEDLVGLASEDGKSKRAGRVEVAASEGSGGVGSAEVRQTNSEGADGGEQVALVNHDNLVHVPDEDGENNVKDEGVADVVVLVVVDIGDISLGTKVGRVAEAASASRGPGKETTGKGTDNLEHEVHKEPHNVDLLADKLGKREDGVAGGGGLVARKKLDAVGEVGEGEEKEKKKVAVGWPKRNFFHWMVWRWGWWRG